MSKNATIDDDFGKWENRGVTASGKQKHILVVEDDDDIRNSLKQLLEYEGYYVTTAPNGKEALDQLHCQQQPSLILLDLMMPVMNGWDFEKNFSSLPEFKEIPIVAVTAFGDKTNGMRLKGIVKKPIDFDLLFSLIQQNT